MDTDQDVAVGVHLQEVPIHGVKHEPPGDGSKEMSQEVYDSFLLPLENGRFLKMKINMCVCVYVLPGWEGGVVDEAEQLLRVTNRNEALHRQLKSQGLVLW